MQKSGFPKMRHYVGFSQIGSYIICNYGIQFILHETIICCTAGKFGRGKFGKLTLFEHLVQRKLSKLIEQPIGY